MLNFDDFFKTLLGNLKDFVEGNWKDYKAAALKDGKAFLTKAKKDIRRWTELVADGKLTPDEFGFLLAGKKDVAELEALKQAGLTAVRLNKFRNGLLQVVMDTVLAAIP